MVKHGHKIRLNITIENETLVILSELKNASKIENIGFGTIIDAIVFEHCKDKVFLLNKRRKELALEINRIDQQIENIIEERDNVRLQKKMKELENAVPIIQR